MSNGTIRWFSLEKNFGFIMADEGGDIFVHGSAVTGGTTRGLSEGQRVTFEVEEAPRGKKAVNVTTTDEFREVPPSDRPRREGGGSRGGGGRGYGGGGSGSGGGGGGGRPERAPKQWSKRSW